MIMPLTPLQQARMVVGTPMLIPINPREATNRLLGGTQPFGTILPPLNSMDLNLELSPSPNIYDKLNQFKKENDKHIQDICKNLGLC